MRDDPFPKVPLGDLFALETTPVVPMATPQSEFLHFSLPAFDASGGPVLQFGREIESSKTSLTKKCVLVSKLNPRKPRVLVADPATEPNPCCASTEFMVYLPRTSEVSVSFYGWLLGTSGFQRRLEGVATGTTNSHVRARPLETLRWAVAFPPLSEQRRIVEILDTVDEAIRKTEQLIAKLKLVKQGLLHDLLTRGIDDNGELRDPDRHPERFKDSPIGRSPRDWTHRCLSVLASRITDGTHQAVRTVPQSSTTVPFLYVSCVRDGRILWDEAAQVTRRTFSDISKGREPAAGMVLYTAVGSFGHAAVVSEALDFAFQRHIACIYPDPRHIDSVFLGMWLNSACIGAHGERTAIGNAQRTVTLSELARFPVLLPSMIEQRRIAAIGLATEAEIEAEFHRVRKLRLLKHALMEDLLTGRVRVTSLLGEVAA
jgi:type I restriction enzyme S subunit